MKQYPFLQKALEGKVESEEEDTPKKTQGLNNNSRPANQKRGKKTTP